MLINHSHLFVIVVKARCSSDQLNKIMMQLAIDEDRRVQKPSEGLEKKQKQGAHSAGVDRKSVV